MGVGPSNQAILQADDDLRRIEWQDIEEKLQFFRRWDIMDAQEAIEQFKGVEHVMDKNREHMSREEAADLMALRTCWAEFFEIMYAVEAKRRRKLEDRERNLWHPACESFAMIYDMDAKDAYDEYMLGDTVRPHDEIYAEGAHTDDEKSEDGEEGEDEDGSEDEDAEGGGEEGDDGAGDDDEGGDGEKAEADGGGGGGGGVDEEQQLEKKDGEGDGAAPQPAEGDGDGAGSQEAALAAEEGAVVVAGGAPTPFEDDASSDGEEPEDDEAGGEDEEEGEEEEKKGASPRNQGDDSGEAPPPKTKKKALGGLVFHDGQWRKEEDVNREQHAAAEAERVARRELPPEFDTTKVSPVFFGYGMTKVQDVYEADAAGIREIEEQEEAIVAKQLALRKEEVETEMETDAQRRAARERKREKMLQDHENAKKTREGELVTAKKMMSAAQFRNFEVTWKSDEVAVQRANAVEVDELVTHNKQIWNEEELRMTKMKAALDSAVAAQSNDSPSGEKLERDARNALNARVTELDLACRTLEEAQQRLKLTREEMLESDGTDANARSVLIHVEHEVEKGEHEVEKCLEAVDEAEMVLNRAVKRRAKEARVIPLYKPLASSLTDDDFTAPAMDIVTALIVTCTDKLAEKLRILVTMFDFNNDGFLDAIELRDLLLSLCRSLRAIGYFKVDIRADEVESIVMRALHDMGIDLVHADGGLTLFESRTWVRGIISKSPYLASLFGCDYEYGELSAYQRQMISVAHQFEMGLLTLPDLKYHCAHKSLVYRKHLEPDNKLTMHERALSMGSDDPLKPDYSRFLPKKKKRTLTNVVPLEHGHLANLSVYRHTVMLKCATKLQNIYRGLQARRKAEFQARKQAFLQARKVALDEARKQVEAEFEAKEALEGTAKMKWDSKLRLRQSKLTAQGKVLDRAAVLALFLDEAMQQKEDKVMKRFHELAVERGFEEPGPPEDHSKKFEVPDIDPEDDPRFKKPKSMFGKLTEAAGKLAFGDDDGEIGDTAIATPRPNEEEAKEVQTSVQAQILALTTERRKHMLVGSYPPELYATGMTDEENALHMQLQIPNPSPQELYDRLRQLSPTFTQLKTEELLLELPSKPLLAQYVGTFARLADLEADLVEHFRLVRHSAALAVTLRQVCGADLEVGLMRGTMEHMRRSQDGVVQVLADEEAAAGLKVAKATAEKRMRATGRNNDVSPEEKLALQEEKDKKEISSREDLAAEHEASMEKFAKKLRDVKAALKELKRRKVHMDRYYLETKGEKVRIDVLPKHRLDWVQRYRNAMAAPESTGAESRAKYQEVVSLGTEFLELAKRGAMVVVNEFYLPLEQKTIQACGERAVDGRCKEGGRGIDGLKYKYEAYNIRFKLWRDDHGVFNGSDEFAAKAAGNDLRACLEYFKLHTPQLTIPLTCVVDYHGFRVLCVAKLPLAITVHAETGEVRKNFEEMVIGTDNRGETIVSSNRVADNKLAEAARQLNLARHGVKGQKDILNKFLYSSVDLRVFKDADGNFSLFNFWRAFPPEDPDATPHLSRAPRGNSMFWRMLRPELVKNNTVSEERLQALLDEVKERYEPSDNLGEDALLKDEALSVPHQELYSYLSADAKQRIIDTRTLPPGDMKVPLSPDANCMVTYETPDWEGHIYSCRDATRRLVQETIPLFAERLTEMDLTNTSLLQGYGIDLTMEMHRHGINMRHMGILRTYFWRRVKGRVNIAHNSDVLKTQADLRTQLVRGDTVSIKGTRYEVSTNPEDEFSSTALTVTETISDLSMNDLDLFVGNTKSERNCQEIRLLLLAEMVARATKNVVRYYLRLASGMMKTVSERLMAFVMCEFLNIVTGAHEKAEEFWSGQLFHAIRTRYGERAVSEVDRINLRREMEPGIVYIVNRLQAMLGLKIGRRCTAHFNDEPVAFKFTTADLESTGPRVKHNISVLDFARAQLLSKQAFERRQASYEQIIADEKPLLYLKLSERRGSRIAYNHGTAEMSLSGYYSRSCKMEYTGPISNDDMNRAVRFEPKVAPRIDLKFSPEIAPQDDDKGWSVEVWARVLGSENVERVVLMNGRYMLSATRDDCWTMSLFSDLTEVSVKGPKIEPEKWYHLVGTYDGTMARLWVNSELIQAIEVKPMIEKQREVIRIEREEAMEKLILIEQRARDSCKRMTDEQAAAFFKTKEGTEQVKAAAMKLMEAIEFQLRMLTAEKAAEKGLKKLGKNEARAQARNEYREALYMQNVQAIAETHRRKMEEHRDSVAKDDEEARERATKSMRIGATCASKRAKDGRHFFDGELAHLAGYTFVLGPDQIRTHYLSGTLQRSLQADRIYALAAVQYQAALRFAPDDSMVLDHYAESLCESLIFESSNPDAVRRNKRKVVEAIAVFVEFENLKALAEVLRRLPADYQYGDLACRAYDAIVSIKPEYFTVKSHMTLKELSKVPGKFSLTVPGSHPDYMRVAAAVYRTVLREPVLSAVYGEEMLAWAANIESPEIICGLITQAETDADQRICDLHQFHTITNMSDADLSILADNRRLTLAFNLTNCDDLTDNGIVMASRFCTSLQALTVDGCKNLTDRALLSGLKKYCSSLNLLSLQKCHLVSDRGLVPLFHSTAKLRVLNLNYCKEVTDETVIEVAQHCRLIELMHVAFCTQITDTGLYTFAMTVNSKTFRSMDLSYCRQVSDDSIEAIARKCVKLQFLNVCGVNRITDIGAKAITHNLWLLTHLNFEDLYMITDDIFFFDHQRDGRKAAEAQMITSLTELNISECSKLTDVCLGGIATRCDKLVNFHASGNTAFSPRGYQDFIVEPIARAPRGENIHVLNISYCNQLDDEGLEMIAKACPQIETCNISGCILLSDAAVVQLSVHCTHIKTLGVSFCKRFTDRAICTMSDYLWLEELDVSGCSHLTDDGIEVLALEFSGIVKLDLSGCSRITDESMDSIARHSQHMRWLKLCNCPQVSDLAIEMLKERYPHLNLVLEADVDEETGKNVDSIF